METTQSPAADVLIVEDDSAVRQQCAETLIGAGFSCETAENGLQGLQHCLQRHYRLLLTDLEMPSLHGWGLIARIRATQALHALPIITMTGHRERDLVAKVVQMGVQGFLLKPFEPATLVEAVEHLLRPPAKAKTFATCPTCRRQWPDPDAFLKDGALNPTGFHAVLRDPLKGEIFFSHEGCGASLAISAASLVHTEPQAPPGDGSVRSIHGFLPLAAARENSLILEILKQMLSWQ